VTSPAVGRSRSRQKRRHENANEPHVLSSRQTAPLKPKSGLSGPPPIRAQAASKRSWFITLLHAAAKSFTNFSFASDDP